ncbi:MAG: MnhB domain-containing protein [Hyphomonadaceae bacterium]
MRDARHVIVRAAAKTALPFALLFALHLALFGGGALAGGALAALAIFLHALVFGVEATKRALPPFALRLAAFAGAALALLSAAAAFGGHAPPPFLAPLGAYLLIGAAFALALLAFAGRAHDLPDGDW